MVLNKAEEGEMFSSFKDWRKTVRTPSYRVTKSPNKFQMRLVLGLAVFGAFLLYIFYSSDSSDEEPEKEAPQHVSENSARSCPNRWGFNRTYPITKPKKVHESVQFKIGLISDMDTSSRSKLESNTWISYYLQGTLLWNPLAQTVSITFDKMNFKTLKTKFSHDGRGMELSELVTFDGKLLSFDDRTGIIYIIEDTTAYPWLLLINGDGKTNKGTFYYYYLRYLKYLGKPSFIKGIPLSVLRI